MANHEFQQDKINKSDTDKMNRLIAMEAMERYAEQKAKEFSKWFSGDNKIVNFDFDKLYKEFETEQIFEKKMMKETGMVNYPEKEIILQLMKEFAQRKCAEQRSLCARAYEKSDWVETKDCIENILNAEEPTYE